MSIDAFFSDDMAKTLAAVAILVGVVVLVGAALAMVLPLRRRVPVENEHRAAPRRKVLKAARIEFSGSSFDCIVRNISETGAAIELTNALQCPLAFALTLAADGSTRNCQLVWRRGRRIGVKFK